jgi:signal transduction histidine kinase
MTADISPLPIEGQTRSKSARLAIVAGVYLVIVVTATLLPFFSPLGLNPVVTPAYQGIRLCAWVIWLIAVLVTMARQPDNPLWKIMFGHMVAAQIWVLSYAGESITWTLSLTLADLWVATGVHLLLAFPSGHLRDRWDRAFVGFAYVVVIGSSLLAMLTWDPHRPCDPVCIRNMLVVLPSDDLHRFISQAAVVIFVAASPVLVILMSRHWRASSPVRRRALLPVIVALPILLSSHLLELIAKRFGIEPLNAFFASPLEALRILIIPIAILLAVLRLRLNRGRISELVVQLGHGVPVGRLQDVFAHTLDDPTVRLAFASPSGTGFVDTAGQPTALPATDESRMVTRLVRDGELLGVIVHDPTIEAEDPGLVEAVGSVARLALENERLAALVRAQLEEVRASRMRIVEAADAERRRVERDLHDGAQQRLVALAMRLQLAKETTTGASALLDEATAELQTAIGEVRGLARGLHPTILTEAGLGAAVEALAERTPLPVVVDVPERRYETRLEATAYFVVAEALTNVARYASATEARVTVRDEGERLVLLVADDGRGGADPALGSGLRGLSDRLEAVGGRLTISSPPGGGTVLQAELPIDATGASPADADPIGEMPKGVEPAVRRKGLD